MRTSIVAISCRSPRTSWCARAGLGLVAFLALSVTCGAETDGESASATPLEAAAAVRLVVDYGDGVQKHFTELAWHDGATVLDVMEAARRHPRGINFKTRGKGATLLVLEIDDLGNEAAAGEGRNWIYRVNDKVSGTSAGICPVRRGDTVLWRFEKYR